MKVSKGLNLLEWTGGLLPQGLLVRGAKNTWNGMWLALMQELAPQKDDGSYDRPRYAFDGSIDDRVGAEFPVQRGRYHLFLGNPCPWCHRVGLVLALRGIDKHISTTFMIDDPEKASRGGWIFAGRDPIFGAEDLRGVYVALKPDYVGRCTAPLLIDRKMRKAVCNESSSIVRMLNKFDIGEGPFIDLCPENMKEQIDKLNGFLYDKINNGVYKCGFATSQAAYDRSEKELHQALAIINDRLEKQRFLLGERITECDVLLYPTVARFDMIYAHLFRCGRKRIKDYVHIQRWMEQFHRLSGVHQTLDAENARTSYYRQMFPLNPSLLVPGGPDAIDVGLKEAPSCGMDDPTWFHWKS